MSKGYTPSVGGADMPGAACGYFSTDPCVNVDVDSRLRTSFDLNDGWNLLGKSAARQVIQSKTIGSWLKRELEGALRVRLCRRDPRSIKTRDDDMELRHRSGTRGVA